jgi:hypothetical protein
MCKPSTYLVVTYTEDILSQYALKTYLSIHKTFLHKMCKEQTYIYLPEILQCIWR